MNPPDTTVLRIGAWRVDPPLDEISKDGLTVKLEPRAMQLLLCLAEHQGQVVSVEELLSAVWKDVVVTADSVYHTVAALRRVLGDSAHEPVYIANVVRRGYRLVASAGSWVDVPTTPAHDSMIVPRNELPAVAAGKTAAPASSAVNDRSIAVLPFTNLSADSDNDYFGDGLAEEILNALSQVPDLRVAARSSAFSFKSKNASVTDIAERLHVATVLEGSVRRAADRLRITVQLIDAKSGFHLWSERYDRQFADIFEIQDEIARAVVARFQLTLSAASTRPTANVEAYELYIRGRYEWHERTPTTMQSALRCFEESSRLDPSNALAFTGLADCYAILANYGWMPTNTARTPALAAMQRATALAPDFWETNYAQGLHIATFQRNWRAASPFFERAAAINPRSALAQTWVGLFFAAVRERARAITQVALGQQIDPLSLYGHAYAAIGLAAVGELDAAEHAARRALELRPDYPAALWALGRTLSRAGRAAEGITHFEHLVLLSRAPFNVGLLAYGLGIGGRHGEARRLATELEERGARGEFIPPIAKLFVATGLGDVPAVRAALAAAVDDWTSPLMIMLSADLDPFLGDPEVGKLYEVYRGT